MSRPPPQEQEVSGASTAYQSAGDLVVINQGYSKEDFKELAAEVRSQDLAQYAQLAREVAELRADVISGRLYDRLEAESPTEIPELTKKPDFQHALFTIQKDYARSGDDQLGALLLELIVNRTKQPSRTLREVVLDEALATAAKLTNDQVAALTLQFLFTRVSVNARDRRPLFEFYDRAVPDLLGRLNDDRQKFEHLEYAGCGALGLMHTSLPDSIGANNRYLFNVGIAVDDDRYVAVPDYLKALLFIPVPGRPERVKIVAQTREALIAQLSSFPSHVSNAHREALIAILDSGATPSDEIVAVCVAERPYMQQVFDFWTGTPVSGFVPTPVGFAIAHATLKMLLGVQMPDLSIWVK